MISGRGEPQRLELTSFGGIAYDTDVEARRVVLDTSVIVASLRSRQGASFRLMSLLDQRRFEAAVSVPLVFEYEDALERYVETGLYSQSDVDHVLDYLCQIGHRQRIFFLWRPYLPDAKDDMILELAFAANCEGIVTHNRRDFVGTDRLGIRVYTPKEFLQILEQKP